MSARALGCGALCVLALAALPAAAQAHATLEATAPARGAQLARAPAQVVFRFDESVNASLGAVKVFDARGREVQTGGAFHPGGRGPEVAVRLPAHLADGGYTATYRVISADSHPVSGGFTFTIGHGGRAGASVAALLRGQTAGPVTGVAFSIARAVQYAAIALALGAVVFLLACWLPALTALAGGGATWAAASAAFAARVRALLAAAATAGIVSGVAAILLEAAEGEGSSLWSAARGPVIGDVLSTRFGVTWAGAIVIWAGLGATLLARRSPVPVLRPVSVGATGLALPARSRTPLALLIVLSALPLLPALAGHASAQSPVALLLPANVLHVAAMAGWLGGIAVLVFALRSATGRLEGADRTRLLVAVVGRFSTLAGIAFATLFVTGTIQAVVEVASVPALVTTAFGRAVLIKLALFGALVGIGWVNRARLLPALRGAGDSPGRAGVLLRRTLRAELALGAAVLAVTGALAGYAPSTAVSSGPVSREADVGPAHLQATVDPARIGANQLHLYLFDRRSGAQFTAAKQVTVTAALPSKGIAALDLDTRAAGPGHYLASGTLGLAGTWQLTVTVRVSDFDEYQTRISVPVR